MGLKEKIREGKKVAGTMVRVSRNPAIVYLAVQAGLDFIMFDCEGSNYTLETMHDIALTAKAMGLSVLARVPQLNGEDIRRTLEAGLEGIMVPMVETAEQAKEIVRYSKYAPMGERGYSANTANTDYQKPSQLMEWLDGMNQKSIVIAQIETKQGVEHADEIAAVEGIDALFVGPNDLSISLGIPGDVTNPIEIEAINKVADACKASGKLFSVHSGAAVCDLFAERLSLNIQKFDSDFLVEGMRTVRKYADEKLK